MVKKRKRSGPEKNKRRAQTDFEQAFREEIKGKPSGSSQQPGPRRTKQDILDHIKWRRVSGIPITGTHVPDISPDDKPIDHKKYLKKAPRSLIKLYERRHDTGQPTLNATRSLLGKLLSDNKMERAWNALNKSLKTDEDYHALFDAIIEAKRLAQQGIVSQTVRRERYERIAKYAEALARLIAAPDQPLREGSNYRGELDLYICHLIPAVPEGEPILKHEQNTRVSQLTMVECLNELAARALNYSQELMPVRRRSRQELEEETVDEITIKTRARLFSCYLDDELRKFSLRLGGTSIGSIASVVYDLDLNSEMIKKALFDFRKKKQVRPPSPNIEPFTSR